MRKCYIERKQWFDMQGNKVPTPLPLRKYVDTSDFKVELFAIAMTKEGKFLTPKGEIKTIEQLGITPFKV